MFLIEIKDIFWKRLDVPEREKVLNQKSGFDEMEEFAKQARVWLKNSSFNRKEGWLHLKAKKKLNKEKGLEITTTARKYLAIGYRHLLQIYGDQSRVKM